MDELDLAHAARTEALAERVLRDVQVVVERDAEVPL